MQFATLYFRNLINDGIWYLKKKGELWHSFFFKKLILFIQQGCIKTDNKTDKTETDNNKKNLEHQISILEWFLKDHVTLKTSNIAAYKVRIKT